MSPPTPGSGTVFSTTPCRRRGALAFKGAFIIMALIGMLAFAIDLGFIYMTRTELQAGADAAVLGGIQELPKGLGVGRALTPDEALTAARTEAVSMAGMNSAGDAASIYADEDRDVRFGNAVFVSGAWQKTWGSGPYNMIGITLRRDQVGSANGDRPLALIFAPLIGTNQSRINAIATAAFVPASSFQILPGSSATSGLLPFAIDEVTWDALISGVGQDNYSVDTVTNAVTSGVGDGVPEANMYPDTDKTLPAGNRGTIDLGDDNNSNADIIRQITDGLDAEDFSFFPNNTISASEEIPLEVNGDTGLSASIGNALEQIIGQPRAAAVFRTYTDATGNNTHYSIVKFVGIRVVGVSLTGSIKYVYVQPATIVDPSGVPDYEGTIGEETSIFAPPVLIE